MASTWVLALVLTFGYIPSKIKETRPLTVLKTIGPMSLGLSELPLYRTGNYLAAKL
jgi:hypothetical protein